MIIQSRLDDLTFEACILLFLKKIKQNLHRNMDHPIFDRTAILVVGYISHKIVTANISYKFRS
jgi:hypothetical protein